jgi:adenylate cyclase
MMPVLERGLADEATMLASAQRPEVSRITDWLVEQGLLRASFESLVEGYCERLVALDVPIWRGYVSAQTLHPRFRGMGCSWRADQGISTDVYIHQLTPAEGYLTSPFKRMVDLGVNDLRVRLDVNEPIEFPLLEEFRQGGATDYLAQRTWFGLNGTLDGKKTGLISSWTTKRPGGFTDGDLAVLEHLMPRLALALQARLGHDIAVNLLDAYVGPEAGRRILNGEIRRGMLEVIKAVIFYADLRGFTSSADRLARKIVVEMLNDYFDCLVPNVDAFGGQVLKFLGDGLLATFPLNGRPAAEVCELALDAAAKTLGEVRALSAERARHQQPIMDLDLVLHLGDVYYGNVGSADRLDFTVIGPAVNEAARIEALCGQHDRNLLISEAFARAASQSADRLVSIGRYALRGVRSAQSLYTLDGL